MIVVLERALERLKGYCPLSKPVRIIEVSKREGLGYCYSNQGNFIIGIATDVDSVTQVDTLIHEWAHCFVSRHNNAWGIEYARCLRAVYFFLTVRSNND